MKRDREGMRPYDIIVKKRDGREHTDEEIHFLIHSYTNDEIPDYQMSAWLMAVFLNGLSEQETLHLTKAMLDSGKTLDLSSISGPKVDKHSTGGVGDKISLILAPAAAACGVFVPMTSGRGLGFSGGTLDKLESIPGYNVNLTEKQFVDILYRVGFAMSGQTKELAPADKKLYALRDVTGTVENISLITSSILSKKLAENADSIVFDVKFGSGAFMKTKQDAIKLANSLIDVTKKMGKEAYCVLSSMDQPLGKAVGNWLEVVESIECLRGRGQKDLVELTAALGGYMLLAGSIVSSSAEGEKRIRESIAGGAAFDRFLESVKAQGGDAEAVLHPEKIQPSRHTADVVSRNEGYVNRMQCDKIGSAAVLLGAGRFSKEDSIDPITGIMLRRKIGDFVNKNETLATLHYSRSKYLQEALQLVEDSYIIEDDLASSFQLIHEILH
jgi:pyrimidine-nucleoside phosphorylase